MMDLTERWMVPWLEIMVEWSLRWGLVIALLAAWLALRPPRRTANRHLLCLATLAAGLLLPVAPRWGDAVIPWPSRHATAEAAPPVRNVASADGQEALVVGTAVSSSSQGAGARDSNPGPFGRPEPARVTIPLRPIRPTPAAPSPWQLATLAAAVAWAAGVLVLLIRLAGGWLTLARLGHEAVEVGGGSARLLGECQAVLGLSRHVRVAAHPAVATPAVVGGSRPVVLVPTDWSEWPEPHRRACLLHELAHLARYDDWAKLAQGLLHALFFFHPLVGWLLARLDRERELLCDETAVAQGSDPVAYARLLFDMARRPGRPFRVRFVLRPGWLPFLDRRTVAVRIQRLLEEDMLSNLSRPSAGRSLLLGGLAMAAALVIGGLRVHAGPAASAGPPGGVQAPAPPAPEKRPDEIRGVVLNPNGIPLRGATIVVGVFDTRWKAHQIISADAQGRFACRVPPNTELVELLAYKEGFTLWGSSYSPKFSPNLEDCKVRLSRSAPFSAVLVDEAGKPVAGATIRVEMIAHGFEEGNQVGMSYTHLRREIIGGSPLEPLFTTTTGADGTFTFRVVGPDEGLRLGGTAADGRSLRIRSRAGAAGRTRSMMADEGFVTAPAGERASLVAIPAARVAGRVVTSLPGVRLSGLTANYQASRPPGQYRPMSNFGEEVRTDADGRFVFDGLNEGTINVFVQGDGENKDWTYRAAQDVGLKPGKTSEVTIELIRGVHVEGTVVAQGTDKPVEGAQLGVYGPFRPRTSAMTTGATTDARGRYHYRLPSGQTYLYVMGPPNGFTRLSGEGSSRTVTIPDGASRYEVPPIELAAAVTVRGKVLDGTGAPIAGATVVGLCEGGVCRPFPGEDTVTDARGEFRLPPGMNNVVAVGQPARLLIRLLDGVEHEAAAVPTNDGAVTIKLPVAGEAAKGVEGPRDVALGELAGVVVDADGKPIGGVEVDAWTWYPGNEAKTNAKGVFRIRGLDKDRKVEVIVRKDGYTPQLFLMQPTGQPGWVIVLGKKTYFEGRVTDTEGKPVGGARIRANNGPKRADGVMITEIWTEAKTDEEGRYRMYAQADVYDIQVRVPGVGAARLQKTALGADEARRLDIALQKAVTFRANVVDSLTNDPVRGVRLWSWQHQGIEGRSREDGTVTIPDMLPGPFNFQVEVSGYARWWSDEAASEWSRRQIDGPRGWQRNFDHLDFDLKPGMASVTIAVEPGVTVTGRVLDPDGQPVAGATVAPALTGTGNSLTGDTRFSVQTDHDGRFTVLLPASGPREYNLVAHDGPYGQWRDWANGALPPFRTKPGEAINDVELRLTRPATVKGRVTDASGKPVAGREVRASAADRLENRYYDPTVTTAADGSYELKFIRPGEQFIQVAPFWLDARQAPEGTSRTLTLTPGETKGQVDFRVPQGGAVHLQVPQGVRVR
jgi:protocatechuate 3,4-dioxygenase beta subunit